MGPSGIYGTGVGSNGRGRAREGWGIARVGVLVPRAGRDRRLRRGDIAAERERLAQKDCERDKREEQDGEKGHFGSPPPNHRSVFTHVIM